MIRLYNVHAEEILNKHAQNQLSLSLLHNEKLCIFSQGRGIPVYVCERRKGPLCTLQSVYTRDTPYSRSVIAFFSRCPVGEGTTEYTKLRFPEQGWRAH